MALMGAGQSCYEEHAREVKVTESGEAFCDDNEIRRRCWASTGLRVPSKGQGVRICMLIRER